MLEEKKIPYQYIEGKVFRPCDWRLTSKSFTVNPYHKPKELLALNPRGLVPTLEYDNKPLYESTIICEFLEEAYPENTPHLLPSDPYERARTRIWSDYCTSRIIPAYFRFLQHQPLSDKTGLDEKRKEFLGHLMEFTSEMHEAGPYFLGPEPSLIDFIVAPFAVSSSISRTEVPVLRFRFVFGCLMSSKKAWEYQLKVKVEPLKMSGRDGGNGSTPSRVERVSRSLQVIKNTTYRYTADMRMTKPRVSWQRQLVKDEVFHNHRLRQQLEYIAQSIRLKTLVTRKRKLSTWVRYVDLRSVQHCRIWSAYMIQRTLYLGVAII